LPRNRREVTGRAVDDLQYLGGRGLLFERFSELSLALGKPAPQFGVLSLEFASPIVHHRHRQAPPPRSQL